MMQTFISFGVFGLGLIFAALVLLILLFLSIFRKARLSKCWAAFGMLGVGAALSLTGVSSAATSGIMMFDTMGRSGGSDPGKLKADLELTHQLFLCYQTLALIGIALGALVLFMAAKSKA